MKKAYIAPTVASYNTAVGIIPLAAAVGGVVAAIGPAAAAAGAAAGAGLVVGTTYGLMKGNDYLSVKPVSLKKVSI